jgi:hypothetical protein
MAADPGQKRHSRQSGNLLGPGAPKHKIPASEGMNQVARHPEQLQALLWEGV